MKSIVYIKNEFDLKSHYSGLEKLCRNNDIKVIYLRSSHLKNFIKSFLNFDYVSFIDLNKSLYYHFKLFISKNEKVVIGIHPFSYKLLLTFLIFKGNKIYYHTSYSNYQLKQNLSGIKSNFFKKFINHSANHIFAVSNHTKEQLIEYFQVDKLKISIVNHALNPKFSDLNNNDLKFNFIFSGRLSHQKRIMEMIDFFVLNPVYKLNIVGRGNLISLVKKKSKQYSNINYYGYFSNPSELSKLYSENSFIILPSKKDGDWEELFGMSIIEGMSCGLVPFASSHIGPSEIIDNNINGFLIDDISFFKILKEKISLINQELYTSMRTQSIKKSSKYNLNEVSKKWKSILTS